jgi:hypothetical protein
MRRWLLDVSARPVVIREVFEPAPEPPARTLERRPWKRSRNAMMRESGCSPRAISLSSFSRSTS